MLAAINEKVECFYSASGSLAEMIEAGIDVCKAGGVVHGAMFSAETDLQVLVSKLHGPYAKRRGIRATEGQTALIQLHTALPEGGESRPIKALVSEDRTSRTVMVASCHTAKEFALLLKHFNALLQPDLCRTFLRTKEMKRAIGRIGRGLDVSIRVTEYISGKLIEDQDLAAKTVKTGREWTDEDYLDVFAKLEEENSWLSSISLAVRHSDGRVLNKARLRSDCQFTCSRGLDFFLNAAVSSLREEIVQSHDFYNQRGRCNSPTGLCRPIGIAYDQDVFADKKQNHRFIGILEKLRDVSISVLHPNPYVHVSLVDYLDGSSYDIWVTDPSRILIVPGTKASASSMGRLCDHICDQFDEGVVAEYA